jgi:autotransporter-associated beta strand protein
LGAGGAVFVRKGAAVTLVGCSFSGNTARGGTGTNTGVNDGKGIGSGLFLAGSATVQVDSGSVTVSDTLGGGTDAQITGGLTKTGAGTLVLSGANSYTGGTKVTGGTLSVSADNNLGGPPAGNGLTLDGGTLLATAGFASARDLTLNSGAGTFRVASGNTLAFTGSLSGTGKITKTEGGTLSLAGAPSGDITVTGGTLSLGSSLTLSAGRTVAITLTDATDSGQLSVTGTVGLGGATLAVTLAPAFTATPGTAFTLVDNDGTDPVTGTFSGLGESGLLAVGMHRFTISYVGGTGNDVVLTYLGEAPAFTSGNAATFTVGTAGSFGFTATGFPAPSFSAAGTLPAGVTLSPAGLLSGTPAAGTGGVYPLLVTASNGVTPDATVNFALTVNEAPSLPGAPAAATAAEGSAFSLAFAATGFPAPAVSLSGTLPAGMSFAGGVLSGTPTEESAGTYPLTVTASNGVGPAATVAFALTVSDTRPGTLPLYRLYEPLGGSHLLTTDAGEYAELPAIGWKAEGVAALLYARPGVVGRTATVPLRRLYLRAEAVHLLTADPDEAEFLVSLGSGLVADEGVVGHVLPAGSGGEAGTVPLWRLFLPATGDHLLTADPAEAALLPAVGWAAEGVAAHVPRG